MAKTPRYWVYKCKRQETPYSRETGDWERCVFSFPWKPIEWGTVGVHKGIGQLRKGDLLICQQSDDAGKKLVGVASVVGRTGSRIIIKPEERIGATIKLLKERDPRIAGLSAFQGGPIQTVYDIKTKDAEYLLAAAREQVLAPCTSDARRARADQRSISALRSGLRDLPVREREIAVRQLKQAMRDARLRTAVLTHWPAACAACGIAVQLGGLSECHIAHIRDVQHRGGDQIRNALPLCRTHHWAFDAHIWGVRPSDHVVVVRRSLRKNRALRGIHGKRLRLPRNLPAVLMGKQELAWRWRRFLQSAGSDL